MKRTLSDFIRIFFGLLLISLILRASAVKKNCAQDLSAQGTLALEGLSGKGRYLQTLSGQGRLVLFVFDFESLSCPFCLDSFKSFFEALQSNGMQNSAVGVLSFRDPGGAETDERYTRIVEKKLRGFILGNAIEFPILLDKFHIFDGMNLKEPAIFLFDISKDVLKKYSLPKTKKQLEEIFNGQKKD